ncbi:MAG: epoxyqueuosine reductase QueH [Treponema sp.]|nr:epoxyqueuosine reductase QueH [Treponema sp.]
MRLLFHTCCGPCASGSVPALLEEGIKPDLYWYNPNIHPFTEYSKRRESLAGFASSRNLDLRIEDEYGLRSFIRTVYREGDPDPFGFRKSVPDTEAGPKNGNRRCASCYRMRLEKTAAWGAENGYSHFSTSLLVSPWQDHECIMKTAEELAGVYGIAFFYRDFRPRYREGQKEARNMELYMQKYCGCIFSEEERYAAQRI